MKPITNIFISHTIFLAIFALASLALAQEANMVALPTENTFAPTGQPNKMPVENTPEMQAKQAEIKDNIQEKRTRLQNRAQERVINLAANISNRMDSTISRLKNITERIDSRIVKLKEKEIDTTTAETQLANAKASLTKAEEEIGNIDTAVMNSVGSEDIRVSWISVKNKYLNINKSLIDAHKQLTLAVNTLKSIKGSDYETGINEIISENIENIATTTETETSNDE